MLNKVKNVILAIMAVSGLAVVLSFAASHKADLLVHTTDIRIVSQSGNYFINNSFIEDIISENTHLIENQTNRKQTLEKLNNVISSIPHTEHVRTYRTISGRLGVEIGLRNPVVRIINNTNESFYIDERGTMFPLSDLHSARVLIAFGSISAGFAEGRNIFNTDTVTDEADAAVLAGLFEVASFIYDNAFWKAFIDHIYVLPNGKLELIPKNGYHTIEFGSAEHIEKKFRKLKIFYLHGLPRKGWHYYNRINLEYNNQIICSK